MATRKAAKPKTVEQVKAPVDSGVNPAGDASLSPQERSDALSEQIAEMHRQQVETPDYPVK